MKPHHFTLLVTSAKVSFWISLIPVCVILFAVVHYLTTLFAVTNDTLPHSLTDYVFLIVFALWFYSESAFIFVLVALFLTAILTTVIAITLKVPSWFRLSLILSILLSLGATAQPASKFNLALTTKNVWLSPTLTYEASPTTSLELTPPSILLSSWTTH